MTPLDAAVAWVEAGGGKGAERDALIGAIQQPLSSECVTPSDNTTWSEAHALKLWKAAAHRAIATADRERGPGGKVTAPRVPRTVLVTERMASALDRGETVTITGATLVEVCDG